MHLHEYPKPEFKIKNCLVSYSTPGIIIGKFHFEIESIIARTLNRMGMDGVFVVCYSLLMCSNHKSLII